MRRLAAKVADDADKGLGAHTDLLGRTVQSRRRGQHIGSEGCKGLEERALDSALSLTPDQEQNMVPPE